MVIDRIETAMIWLWGKSVGAVAWDPDRELATFEFEPDFLQTEWDLAPLKMSLSNARRGDRRFSFRTLNRETYHGLPGLLADSLPDAFGNSIIDAWLARQGRTAASFSPIERLCYTGSRAMGALEFRPAMQESFAESVTVEMAELVRLAQEVTAERAALAGDVADHATEALLDIIRVGTSAGGARPKAVIALNAETQEIRSGQVGAPEGFEHWLLKFDGVADHELGAPAGYGRIEYAYFLMATACGIDMMPCRLLEESGRAHFLTRRFDRPQGQEKRHLQSLCAMAHFDFNEPSQWSYEQAFQVMRELRLPYSDAEKQYRRMVFNVMARNQDDHTKNIAYVMDQEGVWRLSPAYDLTYANNPAGVWTAQHQMSVNGKRKDITRDDLFAVAREMNIRSAKAIVAEVATGVEDWQEVAARAGVEDDVARAIGAQHKLLA
ncbi:MAG: serine/threonine-protein kinase HipA [Candidatus Krumholzibacteriia bacterium]|jgi:serine/threonine-protein kinase HipA